MAATPTAANLHAMAVRQLTIVLADARRRGADLSGSVYVFFDAARPPGINLAVAHAIANGQGDEATVRRSIEAQIARLPHDQFMVAGALMPVETILQILAERVHPSDLEALGQLRSWLTTPAPPGLFHVLAIASGETDASLVPVDVRAKA